MQLPSEFLQGSATPLVEITCGVELPPHPEQTRKDGRPVVRTVLKLPPQTIAHDKLARFNKFIDVVLAQTPLWYGLEPAHLGMR